MSTVLQAYGSINIKDYSETSQIYAYLQSSLPTTVVHTQTSYIPDWSNTNLVITPVVSYNGANIPLTSTGLTITYKRREGSGSQTNLTNGETVSGGVLTVSANKIASAVNGIISYYCHVSYTNPDSGFHAEYDTMQTYTLVDQSTDGTNGTLLQVYSEDGGDITNSQGSTTYKVRIVSGTGEVPPSSVTWYKFINGSYQVISGQTGTSLTITASMVNDYALFKVVGTYNGQSYDGYFRVNDLMDPYQAVTYSTVRTFKNSQGYGVVYTRVFRNGVEIDPIKSTTFSDVAPSVAHGGDYYYHVDTENKTCVLKKYNGSWIDATETDSLTYKYYRRDSLGNSLDTSTPYHTGRCVYIDPSIINGNMQFICEVFD